MLRASVWTELKGRRWNVFLKQTAGQRRLKTVAVLTCECPSSLPAAALARSCNFHNMRMKSDINRGGSSKMFCFDLSLVLPQKDAERGITGHFVSSWKPLRRRVFSPGIGESSALKSYWAIWQRLLCPGAPKLASQWRKREKKTSNSGWILMAHPVTF